LTKISYSNIQQKRIGILEYEMPKAHLTTKTGARVTIEGTQEEIATLIARIDGGAAKRGGRSRAHLPGSGAKSGPVNLISELIDGGFFKKPKELGSIKSALEELGHYYPVTTLSPILLRLVRKKALRRLKDKKRWLYVG
jgi:hypothetical protein